VREARVTKEDDIPKRERGKAVKITKEKRGQLKNIEKQKAMQKKVGNSHSSSPGYLGRKGS
jgi:hypothetical protein